MANIHHVSTARTVPLNKLRLDAPIVGGGSWTNIREFSGLDSESLEEFGKRVKVNGITVPLFVQQVKVDGEVIDLVLDGQRRYLGAKQVLPPTSPIPVVDLSEEVIEELTPEVADMLTLKALTTIDREELTTYELMTVAEKMKARGKTLDYIGKAIGRDPGTVSKFLTARKNATPELLKKWRKGDLTDEQFKDLASVKDAEEQKAAVKEVSDARKSGDKTEARIKAKEIKERVTNGHHKAAAPEPKVTATKQKTLLPVEQREQVDMFADKAEEKAKPVPVRERVVLEELVSFADKKPPTSDIVKGIMLGVRFALRQVEPDAFGKAWEQYMARIDGTPRPAKKKAKGAVKAKKAKAKAKPAKKAAKKSRK